MAQVVFVEVKETKLEIIDFSRFVEIDLIEEKPIVRQTDLETDLVHTLHEFTEIQGPREVLVQAAETFAESLELLNNLEVCMLDQLV